MRYAVRRKDTGEFNGSSVDRCFWTSNLQDARIYRSEADAALSIQYLGRTYPYHVKGLDMEVVEFYLTCSGNVFPLKVVAKKKWTARGGKKR